MRQELGLSIGSLQLTDMLPGLWANATEAQGFSVSVDSSDRVSLRRSDSSEAEGGGSSGSATVVSTPRQGEGGGSVSRGGLGRVSAWLHQLDWPSPSEFNHQGAAAVNFAGGDEYAEPTGTQPDLKLWLVRIADHSCEYHFTQASLRINWPVHVQLAWPLLLRAEHWLSLIHI